MYLVQRFQSLFKRYFGWSGWRHTYHSLESLNISTQMQPMSTIDDFQLDDITWAH